MKNFQVNIILDEDEAAAIQEDYDEVYALDTWYDLQYEDYVKMELFDEDTQSTVVVGDTTHDNIYSIIYNFIQGMNYASKEDFIVEYGFKDSDSVTHTVRIEYFKKGE